MDYINENKKTILFIIIIILIVLGVYLFTKKTPDDEEFYKADNTYFHNYAVNEVVPIYVNEEHIAKKYLSDYVNLMIYHPENAYKLLTTKFRKNNYSNYSDYQKYLKTVLSNNFVKAKVSKYSVTKEKNKKIFTIEDIEGNKFKFIEKSIMNYEVEILK